MVTHVMIVACYHSLPLSACMLHYNLVSIPFGTSIPTSFNILVKMFLVSLVFTVYINLLTSMPSSTALGYLAIVSDSYILSCTY